MLVSDENLMTYGDDKVKNRHFQQSRRHNSMINGSTLPVFELIRAFIPSLLICKFQEDMIKTEGAMVMTSIFPL